MLNHRYRVLIILAALALTVVALVVASAVEAPDTVLAALSTLIGVLAPAFVDALMVERRRRNPRIPAIADDVRGKSVLEDVRGESDAHSVDKDL